jgi:hypothetical protein
MSRHSEARVHLDKAREFLDAATLLLGLVGWATRLHEVATVVVTT